jgi:hypothetical protein
VIVIASQSTDWMTITGMIRRYTSLEGDVIFDHMYNAGSRPQNDGTLPVAEHAKSAIGAGNSATSPANGPNRAIRASSPVSLFPLSVSAHD